MIGADAALTLFTVFNAVRVFAYVPQIVKIVRDRNGAAAVSVTTWTLFALSHATTVGYAILTLGDRTLAAIFGLNTVFCGIIVLLTVTQRRRSRPLAASSGHRRMAV